MKASTRTACPINARSSSLTFFLLMMLSGGAVSQETTFHTQTNVVVIPAMVKSANGAIVYGLGAKDFLVEDDGVEQVVRLDEAAEGRRFRWWWRLSAGGARTTSFRGFAG